MHLNNEGIIIYNKKHYYSNLIKLQVEIIVDITQKGLNI